MKIFKMIRGFFSQMGVEVLNHLKCYISRQTLVSDLNRNGLHLYFVISAGRFCMIASPKL